MYFLELHNYDNSYIPVQGFEVKATAASVAAWPQLLSDRAYENQYGVAVIRTDRNNH